MRKANNYAMGDGLTCRNVTKSARVMAVPRAVLKIHCILLLVFVPYRKLCELVY